MDAQFSLDPLRRLAASYLGAEPTIVELAGGASTRRFFRICIAADGSAAPMPRAQRRRTAVGMYSPDARRSEEASHAERQTEGDWPFLQVRELLERASVRVPKLYAQDCESGWLLLEDLGDLTLAEALVRQPESKVALYQLAVRDLATAQQQLESLPSDCIVTQRRFDQKLLLWELEHFREYGLVARGLTPSAEQNERFANLAAGVAQRIAQLEAGFVHRDYQSRNLMWLPPDDGTPHGSAAGQLVWIDFQDALLGPRVYDLVALLNDSYQTFTRDFVEQRLVEYTAARGLASSAEAEIVREFDMVTVQRKLKDAGRFVYFERHNGDPSYLRFVEPTLAKVSQSLARLRTDPLFSEWDQLLKELLPPATR